MKQEIKDRWVARLRSGQDVQGHGGLRRIGNVETGGPDELCCLGVLTEIAVEDGVIPPPLTVPGAYVQYGAHFDGGYLPSEVARWAGLEDVNPLVATECGHQSLAMLNDDGCPFEQIAALIEEKL